MGETRVFFLLSYAKCRETNNGLELTGFKTRSAEVAFEMQLFVGEGGGPAFDERRGLQVTNATYASHTKCKIRMQLFANWRGSRPFGRRAHPILAAACHGRGRIVGR